MKFPIVGGGRGEFPMFGAWLAQRFHPNHVIQRDLPASYLVTLKKVQVPFDADGRDADASLRKNSHGCWITQRVSPLYHVTRSILHGYKLIRWIVFWYENGNIYVHQQRIDFFAGYLRLAMVISCYIQVYPSIYTWNIPWYPLKYTVNMPLYHIPVEYPSWIVKSSEIMHFQHLGCVNVHSGWFKWFKSKCVMVKSCKSPNFITCSSIFHG